ncbi:MAG: protein kinase [Myxococcales bacterium]|nr:protein kinase [Myxococcales bacterium]
MLPDDFPDGYEPIKELGEGSMGLVWLAYSQRVRGHCAVKVLSLHDDRRGSAERSFNREVRAMARLSHPSVVEVHDFGRTPLGSPFLAMEYVPGASLNAYVRQSWSWPMLWTLLDGLLSGLGHAHAHELIHRDLKPGNILVLPHQAGPQAVKLVDFGIALAVNEAARVGRRIEGTPAYIAPEAASGEVAAVGPWTDLYSLGVILFEILTGDVPFHGKHLLSHHQRSPLPAIRVRPEVEAPGGLIQVVERLLEKSPVRRYRSVAEVRHALALHVGEPPLPAPLGNPPRVSVAWEDDEPSTHASGIVPVRGAAGPALFHLRRPPLVGRRQAQRLMRAAAEAVINGQGPRVVLIEGEGGLGKSRLAGWLREWLDEQGLMRTMTVRSEPQTRSGGGLRQAILRFVGAPTATRETADALLAEAFPDANRRQNALEVLWPAPGMDQESRIKKAAWVIRDLAGDAPFMLWADDVQWSPEGRALRLIHRLAAWTERASQLLLVVTLRPSERSTVRKARRALIGLPVTEYLRLKPLRPQDLGPALASLAPLPQGLAEAACVQSAGNPLLALEAVRTYLEDEGLASAPTDPLRLLRQRIERATSGDGGGMLRSLLARATLLGRAFTLRPLAYLCGVPGDPGAPELEDDTEQVEGLLERAAAAGLIRENGPGRWRFSHDLVRAELRELCRALPNWGPLNLACAALKKARADADHSGIEVEVVSRHYWEGGERERALRLGMVGVRRLFLAGLMGHTSSFVRRLLGWEDRCRLLSPGERADLLLLGSEACEHSGQPDEAERHGQAALDLAREGELLVHGARAASRLGTLRLRADDDQEAERWLWEALRFARQSEEPLARATSNRLLGQVYQHRDQLDLARTAYEKALEAAREGRLLSDEFEARMAIARLDRLEGDTPRATGTFEAVAEEAPPAGLDVIALSARLELGLCAWTDDDPGGAWRIFEEVRRGAAGNLFGLEFYACLGAAWAFAAQGRWGESERMIMQVEELRFDVRLHDAEAERLRRALRDMAAAHRRPDIVDRVDQLDIMVRTVHSTHDGESSRSLDTLSGLSELSVLSDLRPTTDAPLARPDGRRADPDRATLEPPGKRPIDD